MYSLIFITNIPAFYKINLYNEISKNRKIFVIFTNANASNRNSDFVNGKINFDHKILYGSLISKLYYIIKTKLSNQRALLILGGWESILTYLIAFISPCESNSCIIESSIYESQTTGIKGLLKRLFLKRISTCFCAGHSQVDLIRNLNFKKNVIITGGCGILNYHKQPKFIERKKVSTFLYVGRLSPEKNLFTLVEVFNHLPTLTLNIIGYGPLEKQLKLSSSENIHFLGPIDNFELTGYYQDSDVFILPSISDPWGLVVEEALNNGIPVIISNKVGLRKDLFNSKVGLIFDSDDASSLKDAIIKIVDVNYYNNLRANIAKLNFLERKEIQIKSFTNYEHTN